MQQQQYAALQSLIRFVLVDLPICYLYDYLHKGGDEHDYAQDRCRSISRETDAPHESRGFRRADKHASAD